MNDHARRNVLLVITSFLLLMVIVKIDAVVPKCPQLIQQYFECRHLRMIPEKNNQTLTKTRSFAKNSTTRWEKYIRDTTIVGNHLNESFYTTQLGDMNISAAFDLIWTIYESTRDDTCRQQNTTEFCKCMSFETHAWASQIETLFGGRERRQFYEQVRDIVAEFFDDYELFVPRLYTEYTAVNDFCSRSFFNYFDYVHTNPIVRSCIHVSARASEESMQCMLMNIETKSLAYLTTRSMSYLSLEQEHETMICRGKITNIATCPVRVRRFMIMLDTFQTFKKVWSNITNMTQFVERYERKVSAFQMPVDRLEHAIYYMHLSQSGQVSSRTSQLKLYTKTPFGVLSRECDFFMSTSRVLLSSPFVNLTIDRFGYYHSRIVMQSFTVSTVYDAHVHPDNSTRFTRTFDLSDHPYPSIDCNIQDPLDPLEEKPWLRIISHSNVYPNSYNVEPYLIFMDLRANIVVKLHLMAVFVYAPRSVFVNATGLLMEGCHAWTSDPPNMNRNTGA